MFTYWRQSTQAPTTSKIVYTLQLILAIPAFPLFLLYLFGLFIAGSGFLILFPWVLSSFSNCVLLTIERYAAKKAELTRLRYMRIQTFKFCWTLLWYLPLFIAIIFSTAIKFAVALVFVHPSWFWKVNLWFNILHWVFLVIGLLYGSAFYEGQQHKAPIALTADSSLEEGYADEDTANDERIARAIEAQERALASVATRAS